MVGFGAGACSSWRGLSVVTGSGLVCCCLVGEVARVGSFGSVCCVCVEEVGLGR